MKVLIVEDEQLTAEGLAFRLMSLRPGIQISAITASVDETVRYFEVHGQPDLAFFDIHLGDGISFEIFRKTEVKCPVIFTTAYDQYALKAFEVFAVDYLLKPIDKEALERSLQKFEMMTASTHDPVPQALIQTYLSEERKPLYKQRFMTRLGDRLLAFNTEEVDYFMADNKMVWMRLKSGRRYPVEYKMEELDQLLDPALFFRVSRTFIIAFDAIREVCIYSNSRLKVETQQHEKDEEIIVSRDKVEAFRNWFGK